MQGCGDEQKFTFNFQQGSQSVGEGDAEEATRQAEVGHGEELGDEYNEKGEFVPFEPAEEVQVSSATVRHSWTMFLLPR